MAETKRKGSRSVKEIPADILEQLNRGEIESANLVEFLGVDRRKLIENTLTLYNRTDYLSSIRSRVDKLERITANTIYLSIAEELMEEVTRNNDDDLLPLLSSHPSDIVRCFATYLIGHNAKLSNKEKLEQMRPFAADRHFNVRECAWCDVRKSIAQHLSESLSILSTWATEECEYIRRFASESTRPRGVWCEHIVELKIKPELGLPILESLKSDSSKYVRDSVGNWLNDAGKTQPKFVKTLCRRWEEESDTKETKYIIKRALRTILKSGV